MRSLLDMPMSQRETERKIRQHDSDIDAVYEILGSIQDKLAHHDRRFDGIDRHLARHDARFDRADIRFDRVDDQLAEILSIVRPSGDSGS